MSAAAENAPSVASLKEKPALKVWMYEVPATAKNDGFFVSMPKDARVLGVVRGDLGARIFAAVNPGMPEERRFFYAAQTNFPLPEPESAETNPPGLRFKSLEYVGSWLGYGQWWHLFEVVPKQGEGEPAPQGEREPGEEG